MSEKRDTPVVNLNTDNDTGPFKYSKKYLEELTIAYDGNVPADKHENFLKINQSELQIVNLSKQIQQLHEQIQAFLDKAVLDLPEPKTEEELPQTPG